MAFNFPTNPNDRDTYVYNGITYFYDAAVPAWTAAPKDYVAPVNATVGMSAYLSSDQASTGATYDTIIFQTKEFDYGNNYNIGTGIFTVPVGKAGRYNVNAYIRFVSVTVGEDLNCYIYINSVAMGGTRVFSDTVNTQIIGASKTFDLVAGDTIEIVGRSSDTAFTFSLGETACFQVEYLDEAPIAKIPNAEPVAFKVLSTAAMTTAVQTFEEVDLNTTVYDIGNNFSNGEYVIPVDGVYSFGSSMGIAGGATAQIQFIQSLFVDTGAGYVESIRGSNPVMTAAYLAGYSTWAASYEGKFNKGDKIKLYVYTQSATTIYISADVTRPNFWGHLVEGTSGVTTNATIGCAYYLGTDQTLSGVGAYDKVLFDTKEFDYGANYSSGTFTVPDGGAGRYRVGAQILFNRNVGDAIRAYIYINGTLNTTVNQIAEGENKYLRFDRIFDLEVGETIEIYGRNATFADDMLSVQKTTYLNIEYLDQKIILPYTERIPNFQYPAFENSWVNYDTATYHEARYWKDDKGVVHLEGMIKDGTINTTLFTLPVGYRPTKRCLFVNIASGVAARLSVDSDGSVDQATGINTYVSLEGITFSTD